MIGVQNLDRCANFDDLQADRTLPLDSLVGHRITHRRDGIVESGDELVGENVVSGT